MCYINVSSSLNGGPRFKGSGQGEEELSTFYGPFNGERMCVSWAGNFGYNIPLIDEVN
jgi:hypothetical protein